MQERKKNKVFGICVSKTVRKGIFQSKIILFIRNCSLWFIAEVRFSPFEACFPHFYPKRDYGHKVSNSIYALNKSQSNINCLFCIKRISRVEISAPQDQ